MANALSHHLALMGIRGLLATARMRLSPQLGPNQEILLNDEHLNAPPDPPSR
jgi:hypothetical protein